MPIYEYLCKQCGARLEKRQNVSDPPLEICEKCGGPLEKQWSLSGFQFKGAGWYVTDYSNKQSAATGSPEKSSTTESTVAPETASKPAGDTGSNSSSGSSEKKQDK
ncbi:MAG: hypothetical protein KF685_06330 [Acidobacteria bacterium]|nr:hypothetical protein [Acidobacteriota bacterium]